MFVRRDPDGVRFLRGASMPEGAAEKFLFRFLDGLPKTKGLFTLNGRLDIPFGPNSYMEVDLLCKEKKVAVEIDGAFHFEDAEHYRRDRRKDFLLQKNGYLVVRFLAEDVTKRLPQVVEELSAALACQTEPLIPPACVPSSRHDKGPSACRAISFSINRPHA